MTGLLRYILLVLYKYTLKTYGSLFGAGLRPKGNTGSLRERSAGDISGEMFPSVDRAERKSDPAEIPTTTLFSRHPFLLTCSVSLLLSHRGPLQGSEMSSFCELSFQCDSEEEEETDAKSVSASPPPSVSLSHISFALSPVRRGEGSGLSLVYNINQLWIYYETHLIERRPRVSRD